jgi:hypothetical protein
VELAVLLLLRPGLLLLQDVAVLTAAQLSGRMSNLDCCCCTTCFCELGCQALLVDSGTALMLLVPAVFIALSLLRLLACLAILGGTSMAPAAAGREAPVMLLLRCVCGAVAVAAASSTCGPPC